jgi:hypothetical protein
MVLKWLPGWYVLGVAMVTAIFMPYTPQPPNDGPPAGG